MYDERKIEYFIRGIIFFEFVDLLVVLLNECNEDFYYYFIVILIINIFIFFG